MSAAKELLRSYQHVISELRLITGSRGVFDVKVDGDLMFSKHTLHRHANPGELAELLSQRLGPDVRVYGDED